MKFCIKCSSEVKLQVGVLGKTYQLQILPFSIYIWTCFSIYLLNWICPNEQRLHMGMRYRWDSSIKSLSWGNKLWKWKFEV